jgi:hypothetical protein
MQFVGGPILDHRCGREQAHLVAGIDERIAGQVGQQFHCCGLVVECPDTEAENRCGELRAARSRSRSAPTVQLYLTRRSRRSFAVPIHAQVRSDLWSDAVGDGHDARASITHQRR